VKDTEEYQRMVLYYQELLNCSLIRRRRGWGGESREGVVFYLMIVISVRYEESCECGSYSMYRKLVASEMTVNIAI
jgi:hypothetical protein